LVPCVEYIKTYSAFCYLFTFLTFLHQNKHASVVCVIKLNRLKL